MEFGVDNSILELLRVDEPKSRRVEGLSKTQDHEVDWSFLGSYLQQPFDKFKKKIASLTPNDLDKLLNQPDHSGNTLLKKLIINKNAANRHDKIDLLLNYNPKIDTYAESISDLSKYDLSVKSKKRLKALISKIEFDKQEKLKQELLLNEQDLIRGRDAEKSLHITDQFLGNAQDHISKYISKYISKVQDFQALEQSSKELADIQELQNKTAQNLDSIDSLVGQVKFKLDANTLRKQEREAANSIAYNLVHQKNVIFQQLAQAISEDNLVEVTNIIERYNNLYPEKNIEDSTYFYMFAFKHVQDFNNFELKEAIVKQWKYLGQDFVEIAKTASQNYIKNLLSKRVHPCWWDKAWAQTNNAVKDSIETWAIANIGYIEYWSDFKFLSNLAFSALKDNKVLKLCQIFNRVKELGRSVDQILDDKGNSLLLLSIKNNQRQMISTLLVYNVNLYQANKLGDTPAKFAIEWRNKGDAYAFTLLSNHDPEYSRILLTTLIKESNIDTQNIQQLLSTALQLDGSKN